MLVGAACLLTAGCGALGGVGAGGDPFTLPVGPTRWDTTQPAWFSDGTSHVGTRTAELGDRVDQFVLGATGAYWMRGDTLMFTPVEGRTRRVAAVRWTNLSSAYGTGRLSPDRTTIFDVGAWPSDAVVYDAETGRRRPIDAPWDHFTLAGWTDADTFFGVAEDIDPDDLENVVQARQVVTCELRTLACTPVSPVLPPTAVDAEGPDFLVEGGQGL